MTIAQPSDGVDCWFDDLGAAGEPVLLVHGITENSTGWQPIVDRLGQDHRVVSMDLRGHGRSGTADVYGFEAMALDVAAVVEAAGLERPHLVGHSLGGIVVSAAATAIDVASVVNVDQALQLANFKAALAPIEDTLRDPDTFGPLIGELFAGLAGDLLSAEEQARLAALRRPDQQVVLGVWDILLTSPEAEIAAKVESVLASIDDSVRYLSLFGADPGPGYRDWLAGLIPRSEVEVWADHGHYPHLVDPDRFVARLAEFWAAG